MIIYPNVSDGQKTSIPIDESHKVRLWGNVAGMDGIEPSMQESKSCALPLGYIPVFLHL